jgi:DNA-binding Xre family transcriptional regulator
MENTRRKVSIRVRLREVMGDYRQRSGQQITYGELSERTGLSRATLESLGSRAYNTRLSTIATLCDVLGCEIAEILELVPSRSSDSE